VVCFVLAYHEMFVVEPGESKQVQAASDPIGLKVAIVYDAAPEGQELFYQRWQCKNDSVLTVTYMNGSDISTFGGKLQDSLD
jgi:membrane-bound inhibitor of C-type lysozyme